MGPGKKISRSVLAISLGGWALISAFAGPHPADREARHELVLRHAATLIRSASDGLDVVYEERIDLPFSGHSYHLHKVVDRENGLGTTVAVDPNGLIVDRGALEDRERRTRREAHGKLHPTLSADLDGRRDDTPLRVSIWVDDGVAIQGFERPTPAAARAMGREGIEKLRARHLDRMRAELQQLQQPILRSLQAAGYPASAGELVPVVRATLPPAAIAEVTGRHDVQSVGLVATPRSHATEKPVPWDTATRAATARAVSKADIVEARGIDGSGITVAVNEETAVTTTNPLLPPVTHQLTAPDGGLVHWHPTGVAGVIASTDATVRGTAPGVDQILSGNFGTMVQNGGSATNADQAAAISWAVAHGAEVVNNSYGSSDTGLMHIDDRMMDYLVRNTFVSIVNSAGNNAGGQNAANDMVSSAGLGYNVLTVGAIDDQNTIDWTDDTMSVFSSWKAPASRWKPDIAAVGCHDSNPGGIGLSATTLYSPWAGEVGCGTSYSAPAVAGMVADLVQRDPGLQIWPEGVKAIAIASALHNVEGDSRRSERDGAGAIDMAAADSIAANGWWRGYSVDGNSFAAGHLPVATLSLDEGELFRAALAYDSNPSANYLTDPLEGDLDLRLYDSTGAVVSSSASIDSWEIVETVVPVDGTYTLQIFNWGDSLQPGERTYAGVAWWPGHYALDSSPLQTRPEPTSAGDHYRLDTSSLAHWWPVALRPPVGSDYDIHLLDASTFGNPVEIQPLTGSFFAFAAVDIVMIDGNHAPGKAYFPVVESYSGTGDYWIHSSVGATLDNGIDTRLTVPGGVAFAWDVIVTGAARKYVAVKPAYGDIDLGLLAFDSDPSDPGSFYQSRSSAIESVDDTGAGGEESLVVLTSESDRIALVVYANTGATQVSEWTLYVDDTAPEGWVSVNDGAASTALTSVDLVIYAEDFDTGVADMRISNDGMNWTNWEPYQISRFWVLDGPPGLQTVHVQFRNNAKHPSAVYADTIVLENCAATSDKPLLLLSPDPHGPTLLTWSTAASLSDIVYGDLEALRSSAGDFALATEGCLDDNLFGNAISFLFDPLPGEGDWLLVRPADCGGGSYDTGERGQLRSRDPGVFNSGIACP